MSACLGILALSFAVTLGLSAGIVSALYRGSAADVVLMSLATVGIALPSFVIGGLSIMLFVFMFPIFPAAGWGTLRQLVLPAVCLGAVYAAEIARIARTGMLDALSQDYVRTARAKGLSERWPSRCGTRCRLRCCRSFRFLVPPWPVFLPARWWLNAFLPFRAWVGTLCNRRCSVTTRSRWGSCSCTHCCSTR